MIYNNRRLLRLLRPHFDWIIVCILGILSVCLVFLYIQLKPAPKEVILPKNEVFHNYNDELYTTGIYATNPLDPKYPAPARKQANYYRTYTIHDITLNIDKGTVNTSHDAMLGQNSVIVTLYNSLNKQNTLSGSDLEAVTIGCVATDDPYTVVSVPVKPIILQPYERRVTTLNLAVNCIYIGTSDKQYFWQVY